MDPQTPLTPIQDHNVNPSKSANVKTKNMRLALIGVGVLAVILLILVIVFAVQASSANSKLSTAIADGQKQGVEAQKAADDKKLAEERISDTRTYTAPDFAGSFSLQIPKLWSLAVTPNDGTTTISGVANPDQIDTKADKYALRFSLKNQSYNQAKASLDSQAKAKSATGKSTLTAESATVSGISGTRYTGQIGSKIPNGTIILVPIRDKTFTIETDDNAVYLSVFNTILTSVKLNP